MKKIVTLALALCLVLCASVALAANYCINCGEYLGGAYNFCPNCGTRQPAAGESAPAADTTTSGTTSTPAQPVSSAITINRINKTEDGALSITWSDNAGAAPYKIYALQKYSNSFTDDMNMPVGRQLCQEDVPSTTGLANKVVPGVDYWIIVEDCNGNVAYKEYDGGTAPRFNEFAVEADIQLKYRRNNAFEEVYAFSSDDIRRYQSATSFGARINLEYPQLARERQYSMLIAITNPNGDVIVARGECPGTIAYAPQGENGFGYDPVFFVPTMRKTFAQLSEAEKNAISHRGNALKVFSEKLEAYLAK